MVQFAESALAHELLLLTNENRESASYLIAVACLHHKRKQHDDATKFLDQAVRIDVQSANGWALLGQVQYDTKHYVDAQHSFERVTNLVVEARDMHAVYLRLAEIYLKNGMVC
jgi:Tfp pilus assembly protein PilF